MRIEIKTNRPVKDNCCRALYLIHYALQLCGETMIIPTLQFFADKYGCKLVRK